MMKVKDPNEAQPHDQLPSVEDAKLQSAESEAQATKLSCKLSRKHLSVISIFLGALVVVLTITLAVTIVTLPKSSTSSASALSSGDIKTAIEAAVAQNQMSTDFRPRSPQARALKLVQKRKDLKSSEEAVQLYALWTLSLSTEKVQTEVTDKKYGLGTFPRWKDSWNDDGEDWCLWYGVRCNLQGQIVELKLNNLGLTGALPKELKLLTTLTELDLQGNVGLGQGGLPVWLAQMGGLGKVDVRGCSYEDGANDLCSATDQDSSSAFVLYADCPDMIACSCCKGCSN